MSTFNFKQFSIQQKNTAMKVGTDSILLGAWVQLNNVDSILDIGTGTGLLALMMAQRSEAITIDAVEIDDAAYEEAVTNFENSPWGDRLFCYHSSIQNFTAEIDERYDFIIANPPYFDHTLNKNKTARNTARQTIELDHKSLLENTKLLLKKEGSCAFIIPFEKEVSFIEIAENLGFFVYRITHTKDTSSTLPKRSLLQLGFQKSLVKIDELILKNKDQSYSDAFVRLTEGFYTIF